MGFNTGNPCGNLLQQSKTLRVARSLPAIEVAEEEGLYKRLSDLQQANRQTKTREGFPPGSSTLQSEPVSQLREAQPLQESLI